jgi:hypothetical protein
MRILAVAGWDPERTPWSWALERLRALDAAGVEIDLLTHACGRNHLGYFSLWRALHKRLDNGHYDLVAPLDGSLLGLLCTLQRRVPCVVSCAGSDTATQLSALLASGVSVHNPRLLRALWWPPARRRARVLCDGVDPGRFSPRCRVQARKRRGLSAHEPRILFVAIQPELRPDKQLPLAQAAVSRLPAATLEVVTSVPFDEMPWVYASADALLVTSHAEGSPNCVKEALACGIPVVSTDVGDVREVLDGLTNCAVVDADPDALAGALRSLLADGRGCPEGPARVAARYSLAAAARRFVHFFDEALHAPPADANF